MKWLVSLLVYATFAITPLFAALSFEEQHKKEIDAIQHAEYIENLGAEIEKIIATESGYLLFTSRHLIAVKVNYLRATQLGAHPFTLDFEIVKSL